MSKLEEERAYRQTLRSRLEKLKSSLDVPDFDFSSIDHIDKKSIQEANAFKDNDYEAIVKRNEHGRNEKLRDAISLGIRIIFWIAFVAIVITGLIWFYHLVTPLYCHFLDDKQIEKIGNLLLGFITSSFVSGYIKKKLD